MKGIRWWCLLLLAFDSIEGNSGHSSRNDVSDRRLSDDYGTDEYAADDTVHADDHATDDHAADDEHATDDHAADDHAADDEHATDDHATDDGHSTSCSDHEFVPTFCQCKHACHNCERPSCLLMWSHDAEFGSFGRGDYAFQEMVYSEAIVAIGLIVLTLIFEAIHRKLHDYLHASRTQVDWLQCEEASAAHVAKEPGHAHGVKDAAYYLAVIEHGAAGHATYSENLLARCNSELMVLGFLAFTVYFCNKAGLIGVIASVLGGRDTRWGPQHHIQLKELIEEAHMGLFVAMCVYFLALLFICVLCTKTAEQCIMFERRISDEAKLPTVPTPVRPSMLRFASPWSEGSLVDFARYSVMRAAFVNWIVVHDGFDNFDSTVHGHLEISAHRAHFNERFNFALYLKTHLDVVIDELVEVRPTTWVFVMALLLLDILVAKAQLFGAWITLYPAILGVVFSILSYSLIVCIHWKLARVPAVPAAPTVARSAAIKSPRGFAAIKSLKTPWTEETCVRFVQALLLFSMFQLGMMLVSFTSWKKHHGEDYTFSARVVVFQWSFNLILILICIALLPRLVFDANILMRIPPFVDSHEYRLILKQCAAQGNYHARKEDARKEETNPTKPVILSPAQAPAPAREAGVAKIYPLDMTSP